MDIDDKIYYTPGMMVTLKQNIPNKPVMIVVKKETSMFKHSTNKENPLKGIRCRWFTKDGALQEAIFSTKDLQLV